MCVPIIGEPKAVIAREDDAVALHERHAPRHMPWILDGHVVTRGEVTEHQRFAEHAAVVLDAGKQSPTRPDLVSWAAARLAACCSRRSTPKSSARIGCRHS